MNLKKFASGVRMAFGGIITALTLSFHLQADSSRFPVAPKEYQRPIPASIVLLLDGSGSMIKEDPEFNAIEAARLFIDLLGPGDRLQIIFFSSGVIAKSDFVTVGRDTQNIKRYFNDFLDQHKEKRKGGTNLLGMSALALDVLRSEAANYPSNKRSVLLMTDGKHDLGKGTTSDAYIRPKALKIKLRARREGARLFPVGFGDAEARQLSWFTDEKVEIAGNPAELPRIFAGIFAKTIEAYIPPLAPAGADTTQFEVHRHAVELNPVVAGRKSGTADAPITVADEKDNSAALSKLPASGHYTGKSRSYQMGQIYLDRQQQATWALKGLPPEAVSQVIEILNLAVAVKWGNLDVSDKILEVEKAYLIYPDGKPVPKEALSGAENAFLVLEGPKSTTRYPLNKGPLSQNPNPVTAESADSAGDSSGGFFWPLSCSKPRSRQGMGSGGSPSGGSLGSNPNTQGQQGSEKLSASGEEKNPPGQDVPTATNRQNRESPEKERPPRDKSGNDEDETASQTRSQGSGSGNPMVPPKVAASDGGNDEGGFLWPLSCSKPRGAGGSPSGGSGSNGGKDGSGNSGNGSNSSKNDGDGNQGSGDNNPKSSAQKSPATQKPTKDKDSAPDEEVFSGKIPLEECGQYTTYVEISDGKFNKRSPKYFFACDESKNFRALVGPTDKIVIRQGDRWGQHFIATQNSNLGSEFAPEQFYVSVQPTTGPDWSSIVLSNSTVQLHKKTREAAAWLKTDPGYFVDFGALGTAPGNYRGKMLISHFGLPTVEVPVEFEVVHRPFYRRLMEFLLSTLFLLGIPAFIVMGIKKASYFPRYLNMRELTGMGGLFVHLKSKWLYGQSRAQLSDGYYIRPYGKKRSNTLLLMRDSDAYREVVTVGQTIHLPQGSYWICKGTPFNLLEDKRDEAEAFRRRVGEIKQPIIM